MDNSEKEECSNLDGNLLHMPLLVGDKDKEDDERDDGDDNNNNATEEPSVGMTAVHTVLLVPRQQRLLW
jgi:hypothetical protein